MITHCSKQSGFTLVEIIIAMFLGSLLLLISSQVLIQASKTNRIAQQQSLMQEAATIAKYFLEKDIHRAGYYAGIEPNDKVSGTAKVQDFHEECIGGDEKFPLMLFPKIFSINNFNRNYHCLENHVTNTDILVLRYLLPVKKIDSEKSKYHKVYMIANSAEAALFKAMDKNHYSNKLHNSAGDLYEVKSYIYYLRDTGRRCDGVAINGLYREYNNASGYMEAEEIVSGVEQMQFRFLIDGQLKNADQVQNKEEWSQVEAVSSSLLLRADCPESSFLITKPFLLQDFEFIPSTEKYFFRQTFQFDIALRN